MTTIGPSLVITGEITSLEDITVHGRVNGQIRMQEGSLLLAPKAHVQADVHGARITIHGTLVGNVAATERIELTATADVNGTLTSAAIVVQEGALFNGMVDVDERANAKGKARQKTTPAAQAVAQAL